MRGRVFYIVACLLLIAVFSVSIYTMSSHLSTKKALIAEADAAIETLNAQIAESNKEYEYRKTDEYTIRVARDELHMLFPDEYLYVTA